MKKYTKNLLASAIAGMALTGMVITTASAQAQMPNQQMMTQGQAQGATPGSMPGYGGGYGMQRGGGPGYGPGMAGAYGPGMSGGGCPMGMMGGGMGPGMMGGMGAYGPGAGMMMGGGFGQGYGMGPGMMGGNYGPGYGMGGGAYGPAALMDLTDEQTTTLEKIQTEAMKKQRALMRQMWDEQETLGDLLRAEKRDPAAIGKAYGKLAELQGQAMQIRIATENRAAEVFTKEQQAQMRRGFGRGMMGY